MATTDDCDKTCLFLDSRDWRDKGLMARLYLGRLLYLD
jgi:hypothetical protein